MASAAFLQTAVSAIAFSSETEANFGSTNSLGQRHISGSASCPVSISQFDDEAPCAGSTSEPPSSPAVTESTSAASLADACGRASDYSSDDFACESSSEEEDGVPRGGLPSPRRRHMPFASIFPERWAGDVVPPKAAPEYDEIPARPSRLDIFEQYGLFGAPPGTWQRPKDASEIAVAPRTNDDYDVPVSVQNGSRQMCPRGDVHPPRAAPGYDEVSARRSRLDIFEQYGLFGVPPGTWQRPEDASEQAAAPCGNDEPQLDGHNVPASVQAGRMILERYGVLGAGCGAWAR